MRALIIVLCAGLCFGACGDRDDGDLCTRERSFFDARDRHGTRVELSSLCRNGCSADFATALEGVKAAIPDPKRPGAGCDGEVISGCGVDTIRYGSLEPFGDSLTNYDAQTGKVIGAAFFEDTDTEIDGCTGFEFHGGVRRPDCPGATHTSLCELGPPSQSDAPQDEDAGD